MMFFCHENLKSQSIFGTCVRKVDSLPHAIILVTVATNSTDFAVAFGFG
jgi:hypothetical protein